MAIATGEAAFEQAGPGLREVCEAVGIPPVLHMGSCVDNTRILTVLTQMAEEGGLGDDIADVPAVGLAPEWMSEKALAIGTYCAASGAYVIFGVQLPGRRQPDESACDIMTQQGWETAVRRQDGIRDQRSDEMVQRTLAHIDKKRAALGLPELRPDPLWAQRRRAHARNCSTTRAVRELYAAAAEAALGVGSEV